MERRGRPRNDEAGSWAAVPSGDRPMRSIPQSDGRQILPGPNYDEVRISEIPEDEPIPPCPSEVIPFDLDEIEFWG